MVIDLKKTTAQSSVIIDNMATIGLLNYSNACLKNWLLMKNGERISILKKEKCSIQFPGRLNAW